MKLKQMKPKSQETKKNLPKIVSQAKWLVAHQEFLIKEKKVTRQRDALAAERRRLPMVKIDEEYLFEGPKGKLSLLDLFEGRRQLIIYHFMFDPSWEEGCVGCSMFTDNVGHLTHLQARDTTLVLVSRAPLAKIERYKKRMGWAIPWYSSFGSDFNRDFNRDFGVTTDKGESHGLSVFLREGENVFRTYFTTERGVEALGSNWTFLDLTPLGRQEEWEDSPGGWPQTPPYTWWRRHDRYDD